MSFIQRQQQPAPSEFEIALKSISVGSILKEQANEAAVITVMTAQIKRLVRLYQIPGFVAGQDVELADWIYENYKFEPFSLVYSVLQNPPPIHDENGNITTSWRLTPDTVRKWMISALEDQATRRENDHQRLKSPKIVVPIEGLNEVYKKLAADNLKKYEAEQKKKQELAQRFAPVDIEALKKRDEDPDNVTLKQ